MGDWIYTTDINGNKGWLNTKTNQFRTTHPQQGTIQQNTEKSVGFRPHVKQDRIKAVVKVKNSYNSRQYTPHNHSDETIKLEQKHQDITVDRNGNPHIVQKNFTSRDEAPMKIDGPENLVVETVAVPIAPIKFGVAELAGRFGSGLLQNWGRKTVLEDTFKSVVDKGLTDTAESQVAKQAIKEIVPKYNKVRYIPINTPKSVKEIVNNFDSKVTNLRNLKNQSLGKSNTRVFKHNNINYTVDNNVDDITMGNYLANTNGVGKHIEWYPEKYEKYTQMFRDNGYRYLDQKAYNDGVKQLAKDLASNNELLYSKDFLSKVEAAAKKEYMDSFDLLQDIQKASRMLNFKPLPARPKYEIPIEDLASENFSTLNKNVSGVYYPGKHTIYMEFDANGKPVANDSLFTWIHENEHYFQELFSDEFNSKSNKTFIDRGYTSPDSYGLKFMSLVDNINYSEASLSLAEKGSTNKENLLPYYEFFIKQDKDFNYNDVNNLIDKMGDKIERKRLSSIEYSPNAYDVTYVNAANNSSNYNKGVRDLTEKYKQEFGKEPYADDLIDYGNKNKEFLHKYQQEFPTLPEEIDWKRVAGRLDALKFGLGLIPTAGIILNKHKNGGKMKISFGKSGIHIKKQNEGKFTEYCGGKVTQACIDKAKASGNSKLVKRAVFAENSRHWKHQKGGTLTQKIKLEDGNYLEVSNLDKDQLAGRKPIGTYKGVPQYLKGDGTAGPSYKDKQIKKGQKGFQIPNSPVYFKTYGINPTKFINMFKALRDKGLSNQVAFETTWQSNKERPKSYYSFGRTASDLQDWANKANSSLTIGLYKAARDSTTFSDFRHKTFKYNTNPSYTTWLLKGRDQGKQFINNYIKQNNLGQPVTLLTTQNNNQFI